ncbi:uncharacterized protein LOC124644637 [Helicoverpa zea]|uniref:uncharacterized protein LOC124644637 n=1 Tax=Helicoverpa zea TaxID=7113 RepID=UPI001F5AEB4C|nr:uncharacterized protein LOC124644637 [Helicoverpa zea]
MDEDSEAERRQRALLDAALAENAAELEALRELSREVAPFTPRQSLARTPPQGQQSVTPVPELCQERTSAGELLPNAGEKRLLSSPEEVQEAVRRRILSSKEVPPIGGLIVGPSPAPATPQDTAPHQDQASKVTPLKDLINASVECLAGLATASTQGIMEAVRSKSSKLNKDDIASKGAYTERLSAVITHLTVRLASAESAARRPVAVHEVMPPAGPVTQTLSCDVAAPNYAAVLKMPKGRPLVALEKKGPAVIFYPNTEKISSSEETLKELREKIKPGPEGIKVQAVRRVGNAGVVVETTSKEAATKLKQAAPATLRTADPKARRPLVALRNLSGNPEVEAVLEDLHRVNLAEDSKWPRERFLKEAKFAFKKGRQGGRTTTVVLECSPLMRDKLVSLGRVFIGWDAVEVCLDRFITENS